MFLILFSCGRRKCIQFLFRSVTIWLSISAWYTCQCAAEATPTSFSPSAVPSSCCSLSLSCKAIESFDEARTIDQDEYQPYSV
ncbi:hypothetical protein DFH28DRAFT_946733 [Melampsora americana]|nr:hypothetical protein DFH28DRAFT_946733 [Melampsora americana]